MKIDSNWFIHKIERSHFGSQRRLAPHMGMDQSALSRLIKGDREFKLDEIEKFANLLGVPVLEVLLRAGLKVPNHEKIIKLLEFYANGGDDGGRKAKLAIAELLTS